VRCKLGEKPYKPVDPRDPPFPVRLTSPRLREPELRHVRIDGRDDEQEAGREQEREAEAGHGMLRFDFRLVDYTTERGRGKGGRCGR
jgi:hypothetical protein